MPIYSIVIPIYNAEKYLESCMDSILSQRSAVDYEIILVDDGSIDKSAQLCDRYAQELSCVTVIHQVNQGVSVARNTGIEAAQGQYILFLDSDDLWETDLLETVTEALRQQPDMAVFGYQEFGNGCAAAARLPMEAASPETGIAYFKKYEASGKMPLVNCWAAVFRRQFLLENKLLFPVGISYGEDFIFHMHCLKCAQTVVSITKPLYRYRLSENGVTYNLNVRKAKNMLSSCAQMYRLFPGALLANYYCMKIMSISKLGKNEAAQLSELLNENRDILKAVSGRKMQIARMLYNLLGWYSAARLVQFLLHIRHA